MRGKILAIFVLLLIGVNVCAAEDFWVSSKSVTNGLSDVGGKSHPTVYENDGYLELISGNFGGTFDGWYWNGEKWISDSNVVAGLGDIGAYSTPFVYDDSGVLKLIAGAQNGNYYGYYWDGSTWVSDSSIVNGLTPLGLYGYQSVAVYNNGSTNKLISWDGRYGTLYGYTWNGTSWISDSGAISGLTNIGDWASGSVRYDNGDVKLILCSENQIFHEYILNDGVWSEIFTGLDGLTVLPYSNSAPKNTVYNENGILRLILGVSSYSDGFIGYTFYGEDAPATFDVNGFIYNVVNGTSLDNVSITLTQSGSGHSDTTDANGIYNTTGFSIGYEIVLSATKTNYTHEEWTFLPYLGETFYINQYMIPTNITFNGSGAIHGIVTYDPYHQALNNATVTVSNAI